MFSGRHSKLNGITNETYIATGKGESKTQLCQFKYVLTFFIIVQMLTSPFYIIFRLALKVLCSRKFITNLMATKVKPRS